jgi:hypothetical protein
MERAARRKARRLSYFEACGPFRVGFILDWDYGETDVS